MAKNLTGFTQLRKVEELWQKHVNKSYREDIKGFCWLSKFKYIVFLNKMKSELDLWKIFSVIKDLVENFKIYCSFKTYEIFNNDNYFIKLLKIK